MTPQLLTLMIQPMCSVQRAWLDCPGYGCFTTLGQNLPSLTDLRVDMRPDGEAGPLLLPASALAALPSALVSLHVTGGGGAFFRWGTGPVCV